jgi:hypothetical protein
MKRPIHIPRTAKEASDAGHKKISKTAKSALVHAKGAHISSNNAQPGDVAWVGPCESTGTRVVCYYDKNLDPSDCRNQPC